MRLNILIYIFGTYFCSAKIIPHGQKCAKMPLWMKSSMEDRIINGKGAPEPVPWQVSLRSTQAGLVWPWSMGIHYCGGIILDSTTILTAAHCIDVGEKLQEEEQFAIIAGASNQYWNPSQKVQLREVSKYAIHENWQKSNLSHDIAVLKLKDPLVFDKNVQSACLPPSPNECFNQIKSNLDGKLGIASGWGVAIAENGKPMNPSQLQYAPLRIMNLKECGEKFRDPKFPDVELPDGVICTFTTTFTSNGTIIFNILFGDSGGPLVIPDASNGGSAIVYGIASFVAKSSHNMTLDGTFLMIPDGGFFTDVRVYLDWIKEKMA